MKTKVVMNVRRKHLNHLTNVNIQTLKFLVPSLRLYNKSQIKIPRTTILIHRLIQFIQSRVETELRVWRYLLPPGDEKDGHEIQGSLPV